ncbi:MAG: hypothetical protein LAT58_12330, partial [Opitutales bacterium]|nr:hypothetical protein [Opitutales bacterium]
MMEYPFDHEKLNVYQASIPLVVLSGCFPSLRPASPSCVARRAKKGKRHAKHRRVFLYAGRVR